MRPGGAPGRPDLADSLAGVHCLSDRHVDFREMAVPGCQTMAMVDLHHAAIAAFPAGDGDGAARGRVHRLAEIAAQVDTRVHRRAAHERIEPRAERRAHIDLTINRLAHRDIY